MYIDTYVQSYTKPTCTVDLMNTVQIHIKSTGLVHGTIIVKSLRLLSPPNQLHSKCVSAESILDEGHIHILPFIIITTHLKDEVLHVWRNRLLRDHLDSFRYTAVDEWRWTWGMRGGGNSAEGKYGCDRRKGGRRGDKINWGWMVGRGNGRPRGTNWGGLDERGGWGEEGEQRVGTGGAAVNSMVYNDHSPNTERSIIRNMRVPAQHFNKYKCTILC